MAQQFLKLVQKTEDIWISVKIRREGINSTYGQAHKVEGSETFADLIEQMPDVDVNFVNKVKSPKLFCFSAMFVYPVYIRICLKPHPGYDQKTFFPRSQKCLQI